MTHRQHIYITANSFVFYVVQHGDPAESEREGCGGCSQIPGKAAQERFQSYRTTVSDARDKKVN
jgi:hypothetical protein